MLETYKVRENHTNKYQNKNDENTESKYTINDQLLLEMILVAIRPEFCFILVLGSADPIFSKMEIKIKVPLINFIFILSAGRM